MSEPYHEDMGGLPYYDENGQRYFIITPETTVEEVLLHLASESAADIVEGLEVIADDVEGLIYDVVHGGLPEESEES